VWPVFLGTHRPRLDDKGRLALPARFRDELPEGVVITKGQDRCLYGFPLGEFRAIGDKLRDQPLSARALREYSRTLFGSATQEQPDKQGRVTLPQALRDYAGLDRDVVVVGINSRFEIWDAGAWDTASAQTDETFAELSEEVLSGVI
jgi:MraZ protein